MLGLFSRSAATSPSKGAPTDTAMAATRATGEKRIPQERTDEEVSAGQGQAEGAVCQGKRAKVGQGPGSPRPQVEEESKVKRLEEELARVKAELVVEKAECEGLRKEVEEARRGRGEALAASVAAVAEAQEHKAKLELAAETERGLLQQIAELEGSAPRASPAAAAAATEGGGEWRDVARRGSRRPTSSAQQQQQPPRRSAPTPTQPQDEAARREEAAHKAVLYGVKEVPVTRELVGRLIPSHSVPSARRLGPHSPEKPAPLLLTFISKADKIAAISLNRKNLRAQGIRCDDCLTAQQKAIRASLQTAYARLRQDRLSPHWHGTRLHYFANDKRQEYLPPPPAASPTNSPTGSPSPPPTTTPSQAPSGSSAPGGTC